jgi:hypothetical protein
MKTLSVLTKRVEEKSNNNGDFAVSLASPSITYDKRREPISSRFSFCRRLWEFRSCLLFPTLAMAISITLLMLRSLFNILFNYFIFSLFLNCFTINIWNVPPASGVGSSVEMNSPRRSNQQNPGHRTQTFRHFHVFFRVRCYCRYEYLHWMIPRRPEYLHF